MARSDEMIQRDVMNHIIWDDRIHAKNIDIQVESGRVTLHGIVSSRNAHDAALEDTWNIPGIAFVSDELEIQSEKSDETETGLEDRVRNVLAYDSEIEDERISIAAENGVVVLRGTLDSFWKKIRAERLVINLSGVEAVRNEIAVVPTAKRSDQEIGESIVHAIARSSYVDVNMADVVVEDGHVTLRGMMPSRHARDVVFRCAENTEGVRGIDDQIRISDEDR